MSKQVNIRLSKELLNEIDGLVDNGMYSDRAEFIREAIRTKLSKRELEVPAR